MQIAAVKLAMTPNQSNWSKFSKWIYDCSWGNHLQRRYNR